MVRDQGNRGERRDKWRGREKSRLVEKKEVGKTRDWRVCSSFFLFSFVLLASCIFGRISLL